MNVLHRDVLASARSLALKREQALHPDAHAALLQLAQVALGAEAWQQ
jgi:hypothetical protein